MQIILFFLYIDWDIDAGALHCDRDWLGIVLVLHEEGEVLENVREFHRDKGELDLGAAVTVDLRRPLEADLSEEFIEDIGI